MIGKKEIETIYNIYYAVFDSLNQVLIGQDNVKKVVAASLLCDMNSKLLLIGDTGVGKTSLAKYLATSFQSQRISITSDMIPSDIIEQLRTHTDMNFLQIDEFNRASGKLQSALLELLAEKQMTILGSTHRFSNFYVFATQNSKDIAGIFNVPQAVYDRFDVSVYFDSLPEEDMRDVLFSGFEPATQSRIDLKCLNYTKMVIDNFEFSKMDEKIMMQIFSLIDGMELEEEKLFAGSNIRAHKYALKLAKLNALLNGRDFLLPSDIVDYINSIYMHRINQNIAVIGEQNVEDSFAKVQEKILSIKRKRG